jgi:hypothetical protein
MLALLFSGQRRLHGLLSKNPGIATGRKHHDGRPNPYTTYVVSMRTIITMYAGK